MAGCGNPPPVPHVESAVLSNQGLGKGVHGVQMLVEPDAGARPLVRILDHARSTIFVEAYIFTDVVLEHALERASAQGVQVYVLLEPHPFGMGSQPRREADRLRAAGINVRWARADVALTHAKVMVVDDRLAVISTANFSRAGFSGDRDIVDLDSCRPDVHAVSNVFRMDWNRTRGRLDDPNLIVAPRGARLDLTDLIRRARSSVRVYMEEITDARVEDHLISAERRGVAVRIILPQGTSPQAVRALARGGVAVRELASPYVHAKVISVDGREAFTGSENLSAQSLDRNREIGLLVSGSDVPLLDRVFDRDWRAAKPALSSPSG